MRARPCACIRRGAGLGRFQSTRPWGRDPLGRGDKAAADAATQEMRNASEKMGEQAADIAMKKIHPKEKPKKLVSKITENGKQGEFDRIYQVGDDVYLIEAKGGGSTRGTRKAGDQIVEQGTPEYRDALIQIMRDKIDHPSTSPKHRRDLKETLNAIEKAQKNKTLKYIQVSQRLTSDGSLRPRINVIEFGPSMLVN